MDKPHLSLPPPLLLQLKTKGLIHLCESGIFFLDDQSWHFANWLEAATASQLAYIKLELKLEKDSRKKPSGYDNI